MTAPHDYERVDAAILETIRAGVSPYAARRHGVPLDMCVVDRRLQALRKAGKIGYGGVPRGWHLAEASK